ncbi:class I SAM-dependent methyltransferase [Tsukamurella sp. 1534]|uniref:class I SAM-dependent methyltransferase n=1 Tax=Tsukamurella sp. 1534 TaxID=1151061 RepID=UPI0002DA6B44|nr:class I SAM-dependent methyltransferase [Tsukamurella sp. 1534]
MIGLALNRGNRSLVGAAIDASGATTGAAVADVGFGGGVGLELLLRRVGTPGRVHGVEVSDTMLAQARNRFGREIADGHLVLHEAPMEALPFEDGALDAIVSTNTIYFVEHLDVALAELARVLRPGGTLVLGIGDPERMASMPFTRFGFRLRPMRDVSVAMDAAGFTGSVAKQAGGGPTPSFVVVGTRS